MAENGGDEFVEENMELEVRVSSLQCVADVGEKRSAWVCLLLKKSI